VSFEPGTLVGASVRINSGVSVSGTVEERAIIVS
jgi:glucose-1-phosphate thymidylyltransferase